MGQGQKSLYMTHLLLVVNICTRYGKDPSNGRKSHGADMISFPNCWSKSWTYDLEDMGQGKNVTIHDTSSLSGEYLYQVRKVSFQWKESYGVKKI